MFTAIEFKPWHFDAMHMREFERARVTKESIVLAASRGSAQTVIDDTDQIIAVIGFYHIFNSVIEVFMVPSIYVSRYGFQFVRLMRRYLDSLEKSMPIHRIQTLALAGIDDKWMAVLGFRFEGTLAKYTDDGLDFRMWARVKHE